MFLVASFSSGGFFYSVLFFLGRLTVPFSLFSERRFRLLFFFDVVFFAGPSSTQLFPYWFCSHQFAEIGSIHCLAFSAWACSLASLCLAILFLTICSAVFCCCFFCFCFWGGGGRGSCWYTDLFFWYLCLGLSHFSDALLLPRFSSFWFRSF